MSEKPNFKKWAYNIAWRAECGEGLEINLPYELEKALEDAYLLGVMDGRLRSRINIQGTITGRIKSG